MANYTTTYKNAVHFCNNHYILCNNIAEIDPSVIENAQWDWWDTDDQYLEIYQYFLSDCSEGDVEFLKEHFPSLLFSYSTVLDLYILCVDHYGTAWDCVPCETDLEYFKNNQYER